MEGNIFRQFVFGHHFLPHPHLPTPPQLSVHYTPNIKWLLPNFLQKYKPEQDLELSSDSFKLAFQCIPHLLASGPFGMVFKYPQDYFHLKD
jgi:hypothetical protein